MIRRFLSLSVALLLTQWAVAAPPQRQTLPSHTEFMVHVDVERIQAHPFGRNLTASLLEEPALSEALSRLPDSWRAFLQTQIKDITVLGLGGTSTPDEPVCQIRADLTPEALVDLLRGSGDYVEVSYRGVSIHHVRVCEKAVGDVVLGRKRSEEARQKDEYQSLYFSQPEPDTILVSSSLVHISQVLDCRAGRRESIDTETFAHWTRADHCLIYVAMGDTGGEVFRNATAKVCLEPDARITILVEKSCRSEAERQYGKMAVHVIRNIPQYASLIKSLFPQEDSPESDSEADSEEGKHTGKISLGVSIDGKGVDESGELDAEALEELSQVMGRTVRAKYEDHVLKIRARAYPEKAEISVRSEDKEHSANILLRLRSTREPQVAAEPADSPKR